MGSDTYWAVGFGLLITNTIFLLYLQFAGKCASVLVIFC